MSKARPTPAFPWLKASHVFYAAAFGARTSKDLEPLYREPPQESFGGHGSSLVCFKCAIPDGEGVGTVLQVLTFKGYLGFAADGELLKLSTPAHMARQARDYLGAAIVRENLRAVQTGAGPVPAAEFWLRLVPGRELRVPLGPFGAVAIRAA